MVWEGVAHMAIRTVQVKLSNAEKEAVNRTEVAFAELLQASQKRAFSPVQPTVRVRREKNLVASYLKSLANSA